VSARRLRVYKKHDFPVDEIRRFLEPGPIVLVSSAWKGKTNIMTMGWHTGMGFSPSLVGCYIWDANHSHDMIRRSKECVINIPTVDIADTVIGIGNTDGDRIDKFAEFKLTAAPADEVSAPLIGECYASFECKLVNAKLVREHNFFIFEVVKGHAPKSPKYPKTIHYRGDGVFMISGENTTRYKRLFKPEML
jgi:flavin reductase (DIM6/NTAB) family NADH-FMN oxidoreductase RutF